MQETFLSPAFFLKKDCKKRDNEYEIYVNDWAAFETVLKMFQQALQLRNIPNFSIFFNVENCG